MAIKLKTLFKATYKKPGPEVNLDIRKVKLILLQEDGSVDMSGTQREYAVLKVLFKTPAELEIERKAAEERADGDGQF